MYFYHQLTSTFNKMKNFKFNFENKSQYARFNFYNLFSKFTVNILIKILL